MKPYIKCSNEIREFIEAITPDNLDAVYTACDMLNNFWKDHCEEHVTVFWFIGYTRHNHGAKGAWTTLDFHLKRKIESMGLTPASFL